MGVDPLISNLRVLLERGSDNSDSSEDKSSVDCGLAAYLGIKSVGPRVALLLFCARF